MEAKRQEMVEIPWRRLPLSQGKPSPRRPWLMRSCIPGLPAWSSWGMGGGWGRISKLPRDVGFPLWEVWLLCWMSAGRAMKPAKPSVLQAATLGGTWGCPILRTPLSQERTWPLTPKVAQTSQRTCSAGVFYTLQQNLTMVHDGF